MKISWVRGVDRKIRKCEITQNKEEVKVVEYKTVSLKISPDEHRQIKRLSADTGRTIKDLVMECMQRLIREYEEGQKG